MLADRQKSRQTYKYANHNTPNPSWKWSNNYEVYCRRWPHKPNV